MENETTGMSATELAEERLRLEREALAVERERLASARAHAEAEARLARGRHPMLAFAAVTLLALLCFAGGLLSGIAFMENRQQRQREERLARALSQLDGLASGATTVSTTAPSGAAASDGAASAGGEHKNVVVVVIQ